MSENFTAQNNADADRLDKMMKKNPNKPTRTILRYFEIECDWTADRIDAAHRCHIARRFEEN